MRIDKYLKLTRIIKRRTIAKDIIDNSRVEINGKLVKPSAEVKANDQLLLRLSRTNVQVLVLSVDEKNIKKDPDSAYKVLSETDNEN